jgi:phosphate-selective porin OprO and OprP
VQPLPEPAPPPPPAEKKPAAPAVKISGAAGKGVTFDAGDDFALNIRSRFQIRYQLDSSKSGDAPRVFEQTASIGTARLWLSGHALKPELEYMVQLAVAGRDYRDGAISPIFDAYLDYHTHRDFNLKVGQFFVPFDRLRTVREFALQLADRPRPVGELTLDRDVGLTFYSDHFLDDASPFAWRLGLFGGGGTNLSTGKRPGTLLVGRVELRPLGDIDDDVEGDQQRRAKPGLALGAGIAQNWNTNRLRSTTGRTYTGGTVDYFHAALDLVFKWSGFALQAEHLWKDGYIDRIYSTGADDAQVVEQTRSGRGWILQGSYTFDPPVEIVARWSKMYAHSGTDPAFVREVNNLGQEVGGGVNYYFNGHRFKLQLDWLARLSSKGELDNASHSAHTQLDVTF